jgi:hypothetical protein
VQHAVVVEPDVRVGLAELGFQLVEMAFQLRLQSGEAVGEAGRGPGAHQGVRADVLPPLGWDQVGGRVGVPAGPFHPDLTGAQGALQGEQDGQFPVVPVLGGLAGRVGGVQVGLPAGRDEPGGGVVGDGAAALDVEAAQQGDRVEDLAGFDAGRELDGGEHVWRELAEVAVAGFE